MNQKILKKVFISLSFWVPVIVFLRLAGEVIEKEPLSFDVSILNFLHAHANKFLDSFFIAVTTLGSPIVMIILAAIVATILLFHKKQKDLTLIIVLGVAGAGIANVILKLLFHRDRPSSWHPMIVESGFSFPSGHAMLSAAAITAIVIALWRTKWRWPALIIGGLFVLLVGVSRLYLGVHYPSDIIAGWCVSIAWVVLIGYLIDSHIRPSISK
jgi:undecaprenyl-diphosphatase